MKNILLAGATGWVGRQLGLELVRSGYNLICPVRNVKTAKMNCPFPANWIEWSSPKLGFKIPSDHQIHAVINLVGEPVASSWWTKTVKKNILESRVDSTRSLVKLAEEINPAIFINASATGFYGDQGAVELDESSAKGDGFLADVCKAWEGELSGLSPSVRSLAIRIGIVLGKDGGAFPKITLPFKYGVGGPIGSGEQWLSWIHIEDLVQVFKFALESEGLSGAINAVSPEPIQQKEFSKIIAKRLHTHSWVPAPTAVLKLALGEMSELVLGSARVAPKKLRAATYKFKYESIHSALDDLLAAAASGDEEFSAAQFLDFPRDQVFKFFSDEKNLEKLTPSFLNFKVLQKSTSGMQHGTLIDYSLKIHGVPVKWRTEILNWMPPQVFVDTQLKGPYKKWHHTHEFEDLGKGTLMKDKVLYKVPFGFLGRLIAGFKVARDVNQIFEFRKKEISKISF